MESNIILLANELTEVNCEDELGCNTFVKNAGTRTKHCLHETFLHFNNLSLLVMGSQV